MYKLQNKLFVFFGVSAIIPIIIIGIFSYVVLKNNMHEKFSTDSKSLLLQASLNIENKVAKINKSLELTKSNNRIQLIMHDVDFLKQNIETYNAKQEINNILQYIFLKENDVVAINFLPDKGGYFTYNGYINNEKEVRNSNFYKMIKEGNGRIMWIPTIKDPFYNSNIDGQIVVGCSVKDVNNLSNKEDIGVICLDINSNIFTDVIKNVNDTQKNIFVFNNNGEIIAGTKKDKLGDEFAKKVLEKAAVSSSDTFWIKENNKSKIVNYITFSPEKWIICEITSYEDYYGAVNSIGLFAILICLALIGIISFLAYYFTKVISIPMKSLYKSMQAVSLGKFNVLVNVRKRDEIGDICHGFNELVKNTEVMFHNSIEKERQIKDIQFRLLRYQINPHFLYNTLTTIALVVKDKRTDEGFEMIMSLSRILKNTLNRTEQLIDFAEEIESIKDYIYIQQIWCDHKINVTYEFDDDVLCFKVPNMLMQPIVENAINHGLNRKLNKGMEAELSIKARQDNEFLYINIYDNGVGISEEDLKTLLTPTKMQKNHIGLQNINERVKLQYGDKSGIVMNSIKNEFCDICIKIQKESIND